MIDRSSIAHRQVNRRQVLKTTGAAGGALTMPYFFSRRASAQAKTLTFWQFYSPAETDETGAQDAWFADMVASWNSQNETQVELQFKPGADYIGGNILQTAFASGEGPDIFLISPGDFLRYANGNVLADLTPFMEQPAIDDFYEGVIASRMVDGKVYALPMEVEPMAMYYSVDAFEEAGLSEADVSVTSLKLQYAAVSGSSEITSRVPTSLNLKLPIIPPFSFHSPRRYRTRTGI